MDDTQDPGFKPFCSKQRLQSLMPRKDFIGLMDKYISRRLVDCKWAAQEGKTQYSFSIDRYKESNLCFKEEVRFEEVLNYLKAHCVGCEITVAAVPWRYDITVDWS